MRIVFTRSIIGFITVLMVLNCAGCVNKNSTDLYFKVTVKGLYGEKPFEGSSVIMKPLITGRAGYPRGEAVVISLGNDRRIYLPLIDKRFEYYLGGAVQRVLKVHYNPDNEVMSLGQRRKALMALPIGEKGQFKFEEYKSLEGYEGSMKPLLVAFKNELVPASAFNVDSEKPSVLFGKKFEVEGMYFEKVANSTPLTNEILNHLPWLEIGHNYWNQQHADGYVGQSLQPITATLSARDATFAQKLHRKHFKQLR